MDIIEKEVELYTTVSGKCPFIEWIQGLNSDYKIRIIKRINRIKEGNYGDWKKLQNSQLSELRLNFGKGYRIYFKELNNVIILILAGSDKSDQKSVIKKAEEYLNEYLNRSK